MSKVTLGKTGITVDKNGFGALPVQRQLALFCSLDRILNIS